MADPTIRPANVAVLVRLMADENDVGAPDPTTDAIPVEIDSINRNSPFATEQSNEATGSLVSGAPMVVGQAATISFRSKMRGVSPGATYSPTVKPPLHAVLAACGMRPQFHAAIASAVATAGTGTSATLANGFPATLRGLVGLPLLITAGVGAGRTPLVTDYSAARVAALAETFTPALDGTSSISLPAAWSYAGTSPSEASARATDHPMAVIWVYRDGQLWKYTHCRGVPTFNGSSAKPGFAAVSFSGIFAGKEDAAVPANVVVAGHLAPTLVRGNDGSSVALLNRKPLSLSTWSLDAGSQVTSSEDPNTNNGFGPGELSGRTPVLTVDPLATLNTNRNVIADIQAGNTYSGALRHGTQPGNRWSLTMPLLQPTGESDTARGELLGEQITLQARSLGKDAVGRDTDRIVAFY